MHTDAGLQSESFSTDCQAIAGIAHLLWTCRPHGVFTASCEDLTGSCMQVSAARDVRRLLHRHALDVTGSSMQVGTARDLAATAPTVAIALYTCLSQQSQRYYAAPVRSCRWACLLHYGKPMAVPVAFGCSLKMMRGMYMKGAFLAWQKGQMWL